MYTHHIHAYAHIARISSTYRPYTLTHNTAYNNTLTQLTTTPTTPPLIMSQEKKDKKDKKNKEEKDDIVIKKVKTRYAPKEMEMGVMTYTFSDSVCTSCDD